MIAGGKDPGARRLELACKAVQEGAAGVTMGRNIFQADHPVADPG